MSDDAIPVRELARHLEGTPEYEKFQTELRRLQHIYPRTPRRIADEVCAMQRRLLDLNIELEQALRSVSTVDKVQLDAGLRAALDMLDEARQALEFLDALGTEEKCDSEDPA